MRIEVAYENGRLDVFDTASFTASTPLGKENALTNFELRFDELDREGLWLTAHHYDIAPAHGEKCPAGETPAARRRRGWRFLLAEASEAAELESVSVDGEVVLARMLGEVVDVAKLKRSASLWLEPSGRSIAETIVELFDAFSVVSQVDDGMPPESVAERCGCSEELVYRLRAVRPRRPSDEAGAGNQEEDWLEGFEDEDC